MKRLAVIATITFAIVAPSGAMAAAAPAPLRAPNLKLVDTTSTFLPCSDFVNWSTGCQLDPDRLVASVATTLKWNRVAAADSYYIEVINDGTIGSPGSVWNMVGLSASTTQYTVTTLDWPGGRIFYDVWGCVAGAFPHNGGDGCARSKQIVLYAPAL